MMKYIIIILAFLFVGELKAQTHTTTVSGTWAIFTTWTPVFTYPSGTDSARILAAHTVNNLSQNNSCQGLMLNGTYNISGGSLTINDNLNLNPSGTINISGGNISVGGSFDYDGAVNNTSSGANYIEVDGNIRHGGSTKIVTNDGSIRIYSELEF